MDDAKYKKEIYSEILSVVEPDTRVLDLGCGEGELMSLLWEEKKAYGTGIDIDTEAVLECIKKGVSVVQEDIDEGLEKYKDKSYDYVILSETLQAVKKPDYVLEQMTRIGRKAIVTFPNFGNITIRLNLLLKGRMPKSEALPYEWYNTPNIHLLTIKDFRAFCRDKQIVILKEICFAGKGKTAIAGNLFAEEALFLIKGSD